VLIIIAAAVVGQSSAQIHFNLNTFDIIFNGFRGWPTNNAQVVTNNTKPPVLQVPATISVNATGPLGIGSLNVAANPNPVILTTGGTTAFNVGITGATPNRRIEYLDSLNGSNNGHCHDSLSGILTTADTKGRLELSPTIIGSCIAGQYKLTVTDSTGNTTQAVLQVLLPRG
jgi:hypothetical protein